MIENFISREARRLNFRIGSHLASSLSGFIAGAIVASIIFLAGIIFVQYLN